jgi:Holliday junction resolvase RusA-like endonuclease
MIVITLPFPVSVNAMYADGATRRHKSQRYCDWLMEAGHQLNRQRPKPIKGPVNITYEFQDGRDNRRRDAFNLEKGVTDLLVAHGIIEADHDLILRRGVVTWNHEVEGVRVTIEPLFNCIPETPQGQSNEQQYRR